MKSLRSWFGSPSAAKEIAEVHHHREELARLDDAMLKYRFRKSEDLLEVVATVALVASRVLGLQMFDVQLQGALALARGKIAEMQTGEGKTLACTPAVAWYARTG